MIYEYQSESGEIVSISRSMKSKIPKRIKRKGIFYYRVYSVPTVVIGSKEPKTLGALADKNYEQMVKDGRIKPKKKEKPWWRKKDKPNISLASLNKRQKMDYIRTGKYKNG